MPNHFFPLALVALRKWTIRDGDISLQLRGAQDRFAALWLRKRTLSQEAAALFDAGTAAYLTYFAELSQLRTAKFKIETWDAGW
ncbi:MAG: hypothetical protein KGI64_02250 [Xanthomonadaceae bacterium]|nr:hypothetical protein [Xanthomonadaceae bacterium]MDE2083665.1 hypothetical protein [Xanthomonadaceae bacterium]